MISALFADITLLTSFVLLHLAVLHLALNRRIRHWHGLTLLGVQAVVDGLRLAHIVNWRFRSISFGALVAVQAATTALVLWRLSRTKVRAPALYSVVLMVAFATFNAVRSALLLAGLQNKVWNERLSLAGFMFFIAVAFGMAFGFFWMTNAMLTEEVEHLASTDPLTRVYNRRVFLKWCEKELLRTHRSGVPFSVLMLDLDHFKRINDNFGHPRGDQVLCATVERIQDSVRGIDVICRWGGEEFAVLLPNAPVDATRIVAERIREHIHRMNVPLDPSSNLEMNPMERLTVSIGAATYRDLDDDIPAMLLRADRALYQAKSTGRNQVLVAG